MTTSSLISNPEPLDPDYTPETLQKRSDLQDKLEEAFETIGQAFLLTGPQGTGKTAVTTTVAREFDRASCYIPCTQLDTEYKILRKIHYLLTEDDAGSGHHASELQQQIEEQLPHHQPVIILDDIDFLLLNDDDSLLYYLSRAPGNNQLTLILITSNNTRKTLELEERTRSSLQPQQHPVKAYTEDETFQILSERAQHALKPRSLRREALKQLSAATQNITAGLNWLRTAAEHADDVITKQVLQDCKDDAYQTHAEYLLEDLSTHHRLIYQAIQQLTENRDDPVIQSGEIYSQYQGICTEKDIKSLSERRISHHLKQLELLNLIDAEYFYGGTNGKTRHIQLTHPDGSP
jgi:Cdc6-like AAA superfamily ATPase